MPPRSLVPENSNSKTLPTTQPGFPTLSIKRSNVGIWLQQGLLTLTAIGVAAAIALVVVLILNLNGNPLAVADLLWKVLVGTAGLGGIFAALKRVDAQDAALQLQQHQIDQQRAQFETDQGENRRRIAAEAFSAATGRLSMTNDVMTRAAAIYGVEAAISQDPGLHPQMVEVLTAFLRSTIEDKDRIDKTIQTAKVGRIEMPSEDIGAAVKVLCRRDSALDHQSLSLFRSFLGAVHFDGGSFRNADFFMSVLRHAAFLGTDLSGARFGHATLDLVSFHGCDLENVSFSNASLVGADFRGAKNFNVAQIVDAASTEGVQFDSSPDDPVG